MVELVICKIVVNYVWGNVKITVVWDIRNENRVLDGQIHSSSEEKISRYLLSVTFFL